MKIPITQILLHLRHRVVEGPVATAILRLRARAGSVALKTPWLYRLGDRVLAWLQVPFKRGEWLVTLPPLDNGATISGACAGIPTVVTDTDASMTENTGKCQALLRPAVGRIEHRRDRAPVSR